MNKAQWFFVTVCLALSASLAATAETPPESWDGLTQVKAKNMDLAYLLPGADFRPYHKVMLDPTLVSFHKDWMKNMNNTRNLSARINDSDAAQIMAAAKAGFDETFQKVFRDAGYEVATTPASDVLRISTAVGNLYISAPDKMTAGRSRTYAAEAGQATLVLEVRDSATNELLGRVVDQRTTRSSGGSMRMATRVSNTADFKDLFAQWAGICTKGLEKLKAISPVPADLKPNQKL